MNSNNKNIVSNKSANEVLDGSIRRIESRRTAFSPAPSWFRELLSSREFLRPPVPVPELLADPVFREHVRMAQLQPSLDDEGLFIDALEHEQREYLQKVDQCLWLLRENRVQAGVNYKRVVVVGGGPVGMMAAIELAARGHVVTVCEARPESVRLRTLGLYGCDLARLAGLGAPYCLFNYAWRFAKKNGIATFDLEAFLSAIARKLGVTIYRNASVCADMQQFEAGRVVIQPTRPGKTVYREETMARMPHMWIEQFEHSHSIVEASVELCFDVLVNAEGNNKLLTRTLLGDDAVVPLRDVASSALSRTPQREHYAFDMGHLDSVVPLVDWQRVLREKDTSAFPLGTACFISQFPADVLQRPVPMKPELWPDDFLWVPIVSSRAAPPDHDDERDALTHNDQWQHRVKAKDVTTLASAYAVNEADIERILVEGLLPTTFEGAPSLSLCGDQSAAFAYLVHMLHSQGVVINEPVLHEFLQNENGRDNPAQNSCALFPFEPTSICFDDSKPRIYGKLNDTSSYYIVGDAIQTSQYRLGHGIFHGWCSVDAMLKSVDSNEHAKRTQIALQFEEELRKVAVLVMLHLWHFTNQLPNNDNVKQALTLAKSASASSRTQSESSPLLER